MLIEEADAVELKAWIVRRLANMSSDADADVLADYTLALLRADTPDTQLRIDTITNLEDFLKENTKTFVDEIFCAIEAKSYVPGYVPSPLIIQPSVAAAPGSTPTYSSLGPSQGWPAGFQESKKRSYNELQNTNGADPHYTRGDRQTKQMRRCGRGRGDASGQRAGKGGSQESGYPFPIPQGANEYPMRQPSAEHQNFPIVPEMPITPNAMPFDPNDPIAAMLALQAMGLPQMPGLPPFPLPGAPNGHSPFAKPGNNARELCRDYKTQGFCTRGDSCPYFHPPDRMVVPGQDEYDPKNALLVDTAQMSPNSNHQSMVNGQRGSGHRGRGRGDRGGFVARRNRAEFSHSGPNNDRSITTIVVEQIPEEKFDEQSVRDFFSEFGDIEEVTMQPYKRLALVKYGNYQGARGAYDSPKVIFDNRFVKVYWYKPGNLPTPPSTAKPGAGSPSASTAEEQPFDREEFERNAQIAQKKLEEKKAQMKETDAKRQALEELAQKQADEKKRLLEKIAAKGGGAVSMTDAKTEDKNGTDNNKASAHTKALRAKVAELEAEAKSLGLDSALSDGHTPRGRGRGRGRGSYRGWEGFAGRGSYDSHRANPRGRGSFRGQGGGKYNLDNRTKKVGVSGVEMTTEKDEALRQHLLGVGEFEAIEPHPDRPESQIITFKDRSTAESFMYGSKDIPSVGKVELTWLNTPLPTVSLPVKQEVTANGDLERSGIGAVGDAMDKGAAEVDYDVAEDDDRWMVE